MKKRLVGCLLVLAMLLSLLPSVLATDTDSTEKVLHSLSCWIDKDKFALNAGLPKPLADRIDVAPGYDSPVALCTPGGERITEDVVSSDPSVLTVVKTVQEDGTFYEVRGVGFGTAKVSVVHEDTTYTATLTVDIPAWDAFYSSQTRSQSTYLRKVDYDKELGTTVWFMRENGFGRDQINPENVFCTLDGEAFGAIITTAVPRTVEGENRYDVKVELPAELPLDVGRNIFLEVWTQDEGAKEPSQMMGIDLQVKENPALAMLGMQNMGEGFYESDPPRIRNFDMTLPVGNSMPFRPVYGTSEAFTRLDHVDGEMSSADPSIAEIQKTTHQSKDAEPYFKVSGKKCGTTTLTYTDGDISYSAEITVVLPEYGFFLTREYEEKGLVDGNVCVGDLEEKCLWLLCEAGFTEEEAAGITVTYKEAPLESGSVVPVAREDDSDRYDLKIILPEVDLSNGGGLEATRQEDWGTFYMAFVWLNAMGPGQSAYIDNGEAEYAVGFAFYLGESDDVTVINESNWRFGNSTDEEEADVYSLFRTPWVSAGIRRTDESGATYYFVEENCPVTFEVNRIWLDGQMGNPKTFSLSETEFVQELTGDDLPTAIDVYARQGTAGAAYLKMDLTMTLGDVSKDATISVVLSQEKVEVFTLVRPENDTVADLNQFLRELAGNAKESQVYNIDLGAEYTGVIQIPSLFAGGMGSTSLELRGGIYHTRINGGINLGRAAVSMIRDVHFKASSDVPGPALFNGACLNMYGCTFQDYGVAVDATYGMITLTAKNVFLDNGVAAFLDISKENSKGCNMNPWTKNTFINNEIAVQIVSFNDTISPYYFRIYESNFIGNGTDFEITGPASVYYYRNYFATWNPEGKSNVSLSALANAQTHSGVFKCVTNRDPQIRIMGDSQVNVTTNPRYYYPVEDWWVSKVPIKQIFGDYDVYENSPALLMMAAEVEEEEYDPDPEGEAEYENFLTSDWKRDTRILNEMADELQLDASAFDAEGTKVIDVLDEQEESIGTWTFE